MRVAIYTLGCKVNLYESEYVISLLKDNNYEIVDFDDKADIYIVNTCSVTNESDRKDRKIINQAKKHNSNAIIIVMGCYSQNNADKIEADIVIGNKDKSKIIDLIREYQLKRESIKRIYDLKNTCFEEMNINNFENHTRAFVKVQDGCNAYCSYCIIPYVRGNIRSKKEIDVINEVTSLVNNSYKEIVLTGIHTGKYGLDINTSLEHLLNELVKIPNIYRIRLSSIEINEVTDGILKLMQDNNIIANHLHIPLQSGSDKILKLMNRKYDLNYFINRIKQIREIKKDISITTDLIVGFPNETEDDFKDTIKTLNEIKFTKIHTFPYSKREGTVAASMDNQVDDQIKKKRVKEVIELSNKYEKGYYEKFIDSNLEAITEIKKDGTILAHTSNYIPVEIEDNIDNNKIINIKIIKVNENNRVIGVINKN